MSLGSLGRFPSLQWARDRVAELNVRVARGENPAEIRRNQREQAHSAKTVGTLAKLDLTVYFKTSWEKPESCRASK